MQPTIIIDAGHGGFDNGATYNGRKEKDDTLRLALLAGQRLEEMGFHVLYTRTTDVYQRPTEKAQLANGSGGDYFVSIHRNASPNPNTYRGIQTLVYHDSGIPAKMARAVNEELVKLGFQDLGVSVRPELAVLRRTRMPAILVEAGFLNTDEDNTIFDANLEEIANGIAKGIADTVRTKSKQFGVQIGLYRRYENALFQQEKLKEKGYFVQIQEWNDYYQVVVGREKTLDEARQLERNLRNQGYETLIVNLS